MHELTDLELYWWELTAPFWQVWAAIASGTYERVH